jgi:hypothetical protein
MYCFEILKQCVVPFTHKIISGYSYQTHPLNGIVTYQRQRLMGNDVAIIKTYL